MAPSFAGLYAEIDLPLRDVPTREALMKDADGKDKYVAARARMLLALADGRALAASVLASEAGVAASTASGHLARLVQAGLLEVLPQGRHRYYRLAGPQVGELLEVLARVAPAGPVRSLLQGTHLSRIRRHQSEDVAAAYVDANREGMEWLLRFCDDHAVPRAEAEA